jgi:hypothetical protein
VSELILILHSATRWAVLALSAAMAFVALAAWLRRSAFDARHGQVARLFVASVDLQVLFGMSLYFGVSPLARAARQLWVSEGFSALWADPMLRFFGLIHPALALLGATVVHAGWIAARRTEEGPDRHRRLGSAAVVALLISLAAIPWPFLGHERPWLRLWW